MKTQDLVVTHPTQAEELEFRRVLDDLCLNGPAAVAGDFRRHNLRYASGSAEGTCMVYGFCGTMAGPGYVRQVFLGHDLIDVTKPDCAPSVFTVFYENARNRVLLRLVDERHLALASALFSV